MRFKQVYRALENSSGALLVFVLSLQTLWLATHQSLKLYIHPRYVMFTTIAAALGLLASIITCCLSMTHAHKQSHRSSLTSRGIVLITIVYLAAMVYFPPQSLSSVTASSRGINSSALTAQDLQARSDTQTFGNDFKNFTIKDWAALIAQTQKSNYLEGKTAELTGFVTKLHDSPPNEFYVARFVVTCCAVDARPIGVAVLKENWQIYKQDSWVRVTGSFHLQTVNGTSKILLIPNQITSIDTPKDAYVY